MSDSMTFVPPGTSFPLILVTVRNCEVQIYHDGITSDMFPISGHAPTNILYKINFTQQYARNYLIREFHCKLTFILLTYLTSNTLNYSGEIPYEGEWEYSVHFYYSSFKYSFRQGIPTDNLIIILVTTFTRQDMIALLRKFHRAKWMYLVINGGILYSKLSILCFEGFGSEYEKAQCADYTTDDVISVFGKLARSPKFRRWQILIYDFASKGFYHDLVSEVFRRTNETEVDAIPLNFNDRQSTMTMFSNYIEMFASHVQIPTLVTTNFRGYQFLTCYRQRYLTFGHFIKPFQFEIWGFLGTFVVTLGISITVYLRYSKGLSRIKFSPFLFLISNMCEEGFPVPGKLEKTIFFRTSFGAWILVSVILVNCYNGIMITDLNAPLPGETPSLFKDLLCQGKILTSGDYKMHSPRQLEDPTSDVFFETWGLRRDGISDFLQRDDCFRLLSYTTIDYYLRMKTYEFFNFIWEMGFSYWNKIDEDLIPTQIRVIFTFFSNKQSFEPSSLTEEEAKKAYGKYQIPHLNSSIEKELVACGKSRHYYWLEFYKEDETLGSHPHGISFVRAGDSSIPRSFESLQETGILRRIEAKFHASKYTGRKPVVKERKEIDIYIKMEGGIGTLFISPDVILIVRIQKRGTGGKPLFEKRACQKFKGSVGSHIEKRYNETC
ncbi:hypothetical protein Fcan01_15976 [Folsomia candida]|uniref:Uncharacterized protein n=1 Tax=Folsomia candida TaxID=158441 RepID=A0A226DW97_FOLCA|nr:hypothetical protein Fcan01_15976 [Folsomia candida]